MILIGSRAAKAILKDSFREPHDYDVVCWYSELAFWTRLNYQYIDYIRGSRVGETGIEKYLCRIGKHTIEFEISDHVESCSMLSRFTMNSSRGTDILRVTDKVYLQVAIPKLEFLTAIKKSHLFVPLKRWKQHLDDYHTFVKALDPLPMSPNAKLVYDLRKKETLLRHKSKVDLSMSNEDFFDKSKKIGRVYVHDDVHEAIKYGAAPLYTKIKQDQAKAACDEHLFLSLVIEDRIRCVQEEAYVIALERKVIPAIEKGESYDAREAFDWALYRICTTLTSGWFRDYALENYYRIRDTRIDYDKKFLNALKEGRIKKIDGERTAGSV